MKYFVLMICAVAGLFFTSTGWSGTIGIPGAVIEQGTYKISIGVDVEEIELVGDNSDNVNEGKVGITRYLAGACYGVSDRLNVFAKAGVAEAYNDHDIQIFINKGFELDTKPMFGAGFKATLFEKDNIKVGGVVQASYYKSERYEEAGYWDATFELSMMEYDAALGCSYHASDKFSPYIGVHYNKIDGEIDLVHHVNGSKTVDVKDDFEEKDSVGIFLGTDMTFNENLGLSLEGRFVNESSFAVNLIFSF
ncbi:MAG: hypothetical protein KJ737_18895 [Proteobacteria bacterium]|nr:hypothetical protein [Pseudomonadota bacterium]